MTDRILFVVNSYPPRLGGLEKHVENLSVGLTIQGLKVSVLTIGSTLQTDSNPLISVNRIPGFMNIGSVLSFPSIGTKKLILKEIREQNISAISVHTRFFPMSWLGIAAARKAKIPCIITEHGSNFVSGVSFFVSIASKAVDYTLGRRALRKATKVLAISKESSIFVKKISGRDSTVFNNAIHTEFWDEQLPSMKFNLVFIGRLVPGKGAIEAVRILESVAEIVPDVRLHIFGDGPEKSSVTEAAFQSAHANKISIHGAQSPEVIREQLTGAVFINPTTLSEGFQTTLLEAVACGARVVTFPVPGIDSLKESGALIFQSNDLNGLIEKTFEALSTDPKRLSKPNLLRWDWTTRASEFSEVISQITKH